MSDTFWIVLGGILTLIVKDVLDSRRQARLAKAQARLLTDLADNTQLTVQGQLDFAAKVDSATAEINEQATMAAKIAVNAAKQTSLATGHVIQQNKEIAAKAEKIEERLNGGPGGLADLTLRVASLEHNYGELAQGHVDIKAAIDRMTDVVKKQSNF